MSSVAADGAVSRKSTFSYDPFGRRTSAKPPPPRPVDAMPVKAIRPIQERLKGQVPMTPTQNSIAIACFDVSLIL
jgi:hypothetical protein